MTSLKPIKGWKSLIERINEVIAGVNARTITVPDGGGLDIQETDNGTLISLAHVLPKGTTIAGAPSTGTGGGGGSTGSVISAPPAGVAGWQSINVIDNSTGTCITKQIYYWGTPPV
jgi:hypothetical protein